MTLPYGIASRTPLTQAERAFLGAQVALRQLGATKLQAFHYLHVRGVRGAQLDAAQNPLARFLRARTQLTWCVDVEELRCYLPHQVITVAHTEASRALMRELLDGRAMPLIGEPSEGTCGPLGDAQLQDAWKAQR